MYASEISVGQGIVNVGQVVGVRAEGAFVFVTTEDERWDVTRGVPVYTAETRFYHCTDEIVVVS